MAFEPRWPGAILAGIDAQHMVGRDEIVEAQPFGGLRIVAHARWAGADVTDGMDAPSCMMSPPLFRYSAAACAVGFRSVE